MALFEFDLNPYFARREEERKKAEQEALLRKAMALQAFGGAPGTQDLDPMQPLPGLAGVTDTMSPQAGLQQELANDRLEQQRQAALPDVAALRQSALMAQSGLDPYKMAQARVETLRGNLLAENAGALTPDARVNAANKQDVSPVRSEGGVFYDRFNREVPFIGMSEPAAALADSRWAAGRASDARAGLSNAQQQAANLRLQALQEALGQPGLDPLVGADIANSKAVAKPQWVKVKGEAGDEYYEALPKPGGGFEYRRATDAAGKALAVPVSESGGKQTSLMTNTEYVQKALGMTQQDALLFVTSAAGKSDQQLYDEILLSTVKSPPQGFELSTRPEKFDSYVKEIWGRLRPGRPVPTPRALPGGDGAPAPGGAAVPAPAPAAAAPATTGQDDPRYEEARTALRAGVAPAKVRQRLQSLGLDPNRM